MRLIAARLGLEDLHQVLKRPTVGEAIRVTIYYHDGRTPDSVATLVKGHKDPCTLAVVYDKAPRPAQLQFSIPTRRYHDLLTQFRRAQFDKLDDEDDLPVFGVDLWLVERAAGGFYHDVVLCPASARGHHRDILLALRNTLPEAVRPGA
jgi:hypothetical protein